LYERSIAAPYAQLRWSNCQVRMKKLNTAIKDGYQTVIDYWPNSDAAIAARYLIGRTRRQMGDVKPAKKVFRSVVEKQPKHLTAVFAMAELVEISTIEKDADARLALWKTMTFDTPHKLCNTNGRGRTVRDSLCGNAAVNYALVMFSKGDFAEGLKALETYVPESVLPYYVYLHVRGSISTMTANSKTKQQGEKLADAAIGYLREHIAAKLSDSKQKTAALRHWYYIVAIHDSTRRDAKVLETYAKIGKMFGFDDAILGHLANWYRGKSRYDDARKTYGRFKNVLNGKSNIAMTYRYQRKYDLAVIVYRSALALDSKNPVPWKEQIAQTYRDGRKINEALAVYRELMSDDAANRLKWQYAIAYTYHHYAGKCREAIVEYRKCAPSSGVYKYMANCHDRLKQYPQARTLYRQVAVLSPNEAPEMYYNVSRMFLKEKKIGDEKKTMKMICKRFPRSAAASRAHTRLQKVYKINVTLGGAKDE